MREGTICLARAHVQVPREATRDDCGQSGAIKGSNSQFQTHLNLTNGTCRYRFLQRSKASGEPSASTDEGGPALSLLLSDLIEKLLFWRVTQGLKSLIMCAKGPGVSS
jgi:hypothetical protein